MKFKTILLILVLIAAGGFLATQIKSDEERYTDTSRPFDAHFPAEKKANDKVVIVSHVSRDDLKEAVSQFLNRYNQSITQTAIVLSSVSADTFALTFPYDLHFNTFMYFIDYLNDPPHVSYHPEITAWATGDSNDPWVRPEMANRMLMLFIPANNQVKGAVYVTTSTNIGFQMGYAFKSQIQKLDRPVATFRKPEVPNVAMLSGEELH